MKIASLETDIVLLPNDEPLAGFSENPNAKNPIVTLRRRTDDGIEGLGVAYFGVARIGRDQLEEYAARRGIDLDCAERWLRPNLD